MSGFIRYAFYRTVSSKFGLTAWKENAEERRRHIHKGIEKGINLFDIYEHSHKQFAPMSVALAPVRDNVLLSLVTVWREVHEVMDEVEYKQNEWGGTTLTMVKHIERASSDDSLFFEE